MSSAPSQAPGPEAETETWSLPKCDIGAQQERGYMLPNLRGPIHDIVVYETHKVGGPTASAPREGGPLAPCRAVCVGVHDS